MNLKCTKLLVECPYSSLNILILILNTTLIFNNNGLTLCQIWCVCLCIGKLQLQAVVYLHNRSQFLFIIEILNNICYLIILIQIWGNFLNNELCAIFQVKCSLFHYWILRARCSDTRGSHSLCGWNSSQCDCAETCSQFFHSFLLPHYCFINTSGTPTMVGFKLIN